jgi:hypothetical protein
MISRLALSFALVPSIAAASPGAEIQLDALGLLEHHYAASATIAIYGTAAVSIGLADAPNSGGPTTRQVTLSLPIYSHPGFRGLFVEPGLLAGGSWSSESCLSCVPDISKDISAEMLVGWSWVFDSGLAVSIAVGAQAELACYDNDCGATPSISPNGYIKLGYAF